VFIPNGLQVNLAQINSNLPMQPAQPRADGVELVFGPLTEMPPGGIESIPIPVTPLQPGVVDVFAERAAEGLNNVVKSLRVEIQPR
jgi:hypothetical protein